MTEFGLAEAQTLDDLHRLVAFAKETGVRHIVYSPAKIVRTCHETVAPAMQRLFDVYRALSAPAKLVWRGGSWRLPQTVAEDHVTAPFLDICKSLDVAAKFCMRNLIETP